MGMRPSDLYPTSTTTAASVTFRTVPLTTSPSAMLRKLSSYASSIEANSAGSISSCCMGLNAGPAGLPARVRPGAPGCPPVVSGDTNPFSAFAITCESSYLPDTHRVAVLGTAPCRLCRFLLRGPAPRGYNGDGRMHGGYRLRHARAVEGRIQPSLL